MASIARDGLVESDEDSLSDTDGVSSLDWEMLKCSLSMEAFAALTSHLQGDLQKVDSTEDLTLTQNKEFQKKATVLEDTMKRCRRLQTETEEGHQRASSRLSSLEPQEGKLSATDLCATMELEGVIRFNDILTKELCEQVRQCTSDRLENLIGTVPDTEMTPENGFGPILERKCRWDLYLPNEGLYNECLRKLLQRNGPIRTLFDGLFGATSGNAQFNELSCVVSDIGAPRQPIHPDEVYCFPAPTYSIFVALQDIDLAMGPTVFLPRTNTEEAHAVFNSDVNSKNSFLSKCEYKVSVLKQGDVAIFDSRTLHCGSANHSKRRAQLYFTLQNPLIPKEEGVSRNNSMQKGLKLSVKDFA